MRTFPGILLLLSLCLCSLASAQIEFAGHMTTSSQSRFILRAEKAERVSEWLLLGDSYLGYTLRSYDRERGVLTVEKAGQRLELPLRQSQIASGATPNATKPRIGAIKIQLPATAALTEQQVRDYLTLKPGDEYDGTLIERAIRAFHRTGQVSMIEIKNEQSAPETMDLVVIVTPRSSGEKASSP